MNFQGEHVTEAAITAVHDPVLRVEASVLLGWRKDLRAVPYLVETLRGTGPLDASRAARALVMIGEPAVILVIQLRLVEAIIAFRRGLDMNVTFTRTAERRYRVSVEGPGVVSSWMEPAPGYDARLPHDMAHFVVENELGIAGGIFGQLAAGGHARTFHPTDEKAKRKIARPGKRIATTNRGDAMLSERVLYLACRIWNNGHSPVTSLEGVSAEDISRVCREFDAVSAIWSGLAVGESMTLVWRGGAARTARRRR